VFVAGQCEITGLQFAVTQHPVQSDAQGGTVRLAARKPNLVESCKAEHPR
jgi:hypothetical protein